jgi:hypothetical protein
VLLWSDELSEQQSSYCTPCGDRGAVLVGPASVAIPASTHRVAHRQPSAHVAHTAVIGCPTVLG